MMALGLAKGKFNFGSPSVSEGGEQSAELLVGDDCTSRHHHLILQLIGDNAALCWCPDCTYDRPLRPRPTRRPNLDRAAGRSVRR
jgi:hypothetical protein